MSRSLWIGLSAGIILASVVAIAAYAFVLRGGGSDQYIGGGSHGPNAIVCIKAEGLPGAAAGKLYSEVVTAGDPFDRAGYRVGTRAYLGYCDADGGLIR